MLLCWLLVLAQLFLDLVFTPLTPSLVRGSDENPVSSGKAQKSKAAGVLAMRYLLYLHPKACQCMWSKASPEKEHLCSSSFTREWGKWWDMDSLSKRNSTWVSQAPLQPAGDRLQCVQGQGNNPRISWQSSIRARGACMCRHFSRPSEGWCLKGSGSASLLIKVAQRAVRLDFLCEAGGGWEAQGHGAAWLLWGWFIASMINVSSMLPLTLSRDMTERQRMETRCSFHGNTPKKWESDWGWGELKKKKVGGRKGAL